MDGKQCKYVVKTQIARRYIYACDSLVALFVCTFGATRRHCSDILHVQLASAQKGLVVFALNSAEIHTHRSFVETLIRLAQEQQCLRYGKLEDLSFA